MANETDSQYVLIGPKKDIDTIYNELDKIDTESDNAYTLLSNLGMSEDKLEEFNLRCWFKDYDRIDNIILSIDAGEAWTVTDFKDALQELFPDIAIWFLVIEPGCDVFLSNDPNHIVFNGNYYLDVSSENGVDEVCFLKTKDECVKVINSLFNTELKTYEEMKAYIDDVLNKEEGTKIILGEITYID